MDRQEFLDALKSHLQVLQDEEQEDILDEYLQHIEMKIKDGLEEEEAIKDFGPVEELAAEILEAYHVKPDLGQGQESGRKRSRKLVGRTGAFSSSTGTFGSRTGARAGRMGTSSPAAEGIEEGAAAGALGRYIKGAALRILGVGKKLGRLAVQCGRGVFWAIGSPFRWMGAYMAMGRERRADESAAVGYGYVAYGQERGGATSIMPGSPAGAAPGGPEGVTPRGPAGIMPNVHAGRTPGAWAGRAQARGADGLVGRTGRGIFRSVRRLVRWIVDLALWCCRMVWNCCVLFVTAFSAFVGLCFLFCLGMLAVLLCQGYPFAGPAIGCLGAVLCCAALTVFSCTFFAEGTARGTWREAAVDAAGNGMRGAAGAVEAGAAKAGATKAGAAKGEVRGSGRDRKPEGIARDDLRREIEKERSGGPRSRGLARQGVCKAIEKTGEEEMQKRREDGAKDKEVSEDHGQEG